MGKTGRKIGTNGQTSSKAGRKICWIFIENGGRDKFFEQIIFHFAKTYAIMLLKPVLDCRGVRR
jgi:hypothetical protein